MQSIIADSRDDMIYLLLGLSFIIHIILGFMIFYLQHQINHMRKRKTEEINYLLEDFLEKIRLENDRLEKVIAKESNQRHASYENTIAYQKKNDSNDQKTSKSHFKKLHDINHLQFPQDRVETSLHAKILQLHKQGLSTTEIAQQLNCGKTEVELVLQFQTKQ